MGNINPPLEKLMVTWRVVETINYVRIEPDVPRTTTTAVIDDDNYEHRVPLRYNDNGNGNHDDDGNDECHDDDDHGNGIRTDLERCN